MTHLPAAVRVYLCLSPCDMRRSFDGLHALVRDHLQLDPFDGSPAGGGLLVGEFGQAHHRPAAHGRFVRADSRRNQRSASIGICTTLGNLFMSPRGI